MNNDTDQDSVINTLKTECAENLKLVQQALDERDEYKEKYNDTYLALDDCARENIALRKALDEDLADRVLLADQVIALQAAAVLALDALIGPGHYDTTQQREAIKALREALLEQG